MKAALLALAAIPAAAAAQTLPQPVTVGPSIIGPIDVRPRLVAPPPCLSGAVIGEEGSSAIVGEDGTTGVIGEKGSGQIIGEEGRVIGERWSGTGFTTFKRVLVGRPGKHGLGLYGCSSASGGETVAVYLAGADGERKTGWRHFVIATRNGNSRTGTVTLPKAAAGQTLSRLPVVIVVENASGKPNVGELRLKLLD
jgi:hypothetical protein